MPPSTTAALAADYRQQTTRSYVATNDTPDAVRRSSGLELGIEPPRDDMMPVLSARPGSHDHLTRLLATAGPYGDRLQIHMQGYPRAKASMRLQQSSPR
jgi:hypothetical protein